MMINIVVPLLLTIVIELLCLIIMKANKKVLLWSIIINIITNLTLNLIIYFSNFSTTIYIIYVIVSEITIVVLEMLAYYLIIKDLKKAFIYSLICNSSSFLKLQL